MYSNSWRARRPGRAWRSGCLRERATIAVYSRRAATSGVGAATATKVGRSQGWPLDGLPDRWHHIQHRSAVFRSQSSERPTSPATTSRDLTGTHPDALTDDRPASSSGIGRTSIFAVVLRGIPRPVDRGTTAAKTSAMLPRHSHGADGPRTDGPRTGIGVVASIQPRRDGAFPCTRPQFWRSGTYSPAFVALRSFQGCPSRVPVGAHRYDGNICRSPRNDLLR